MLPLLRDPSSLEIAAIPPTKGVNEQPGQGRGTLKARITIPASLGMIRPDGIAFDENGKHVYIVDSQGPLDEGYSLYRIPWTGLHLPG